MKKLVLAVVALGALLGSVDARSIRDLVQDPGEVAPGVKRVDFSEKELVSWDGLRELSQKYPNLEELNLSENSELGTVPLEIGLLKKLKNLNLYITGQEEFPTQIYQLQNLEVLDLSEMSDVAPIPPEIAQLQKLKELHLWGIYHEYTPGNHLPAEIGQLRNLEILGLGFNNLTVLPQEIRNLTRLRKLDISGNAMVSRVLRNIKRALPRRVNFNSEMQFDPAQVGTVSPEVAAISLTPNSLSWKEGEARGEACSICLDEGVDYKSGCGHYFHAADLQEWVRKSGKFTCPICRQDIRPSKHKRWRLRGRA